MRLSEKQRYHTVDIVKYMRLMRETSEGHWCMYKGPIGDQRMTCEGQ